MVYEQLWWSFSTGSALAYYLAMSSMSWEFSDLGSTICPLPAAVAQAYVTETFCCLQLLYLFNLVAIVIKHHALPQRITTRCNVCSPVVLYLLPVATSPIDVIGIFQPVNGKYYSQPIWMVSADPSQLAKPFGGPQAAIGMHVYLQLGVHAEPMAYDLKQARVHAGIINVAAEQDPFQAGPIAR